MAGIYGYSGRVSDRQHKPAQQAPLGGVAFRNGVLAISPTHWSIAVRDEQGEIIQETRQRRALPSWISNIPGVTPLVKLAEQLSIVPQAVRAVPAARPAFSARNLVLIAAVGAIAAQLARNTRYATHADMASGAFVAATMGAKLAGELGQYHGAEHKAIAAIEQQRPARDVSRIHPRCGTQLMAPALVLQTVGKILGKRAYPRHQALGSTTGALFGMVGAIELFRWTLAHPSSSLSRAVRNTGFAAQQYLTTREPTDDQLDVAIQAVSAVRSAAQQ